MSVAWIFGIVIAIIPLFPSSYFQGNYYSRSAPCVSLHISNYPYQGWEYSFAVFSVFNFSIFLAIGGMYLAMFCSVRQSARRAGRTQQKRDVAIAKKMAFIVSTDLMCQLPITILGKYFIFEVFLH